MLEISDLGLSFSQLVEVEDADPALVEAWLAEAAKPEIRSPTGLFLNGLRSNQPPHGPSVERVGLVRLAEQWMERVGCLYPSEQSALDELFDRTGVLRLHDGDEELRVRMGALWHRYRPLGAQVERESAERGKKAKEARRAAEARDG